MAPKKDFKKESATADFLTVAQQEKPGRGRPSKADAAKKQAEALLRLNEYSIPEGYMLVPERRVSRINLVINPSLKEKLKKRAKSDGISVNELIIRCIDNYL